MTVEIRLSSAAAPVLAEPAEDLLRAAGNTEPEHHNPSHREEASKGDPVAVAALILSIPGAILATMTLVERAKIAERIQRLLKKVREINSTATLHVGTEPPLDLRIATGDQVFDLLAQSRRPLG